MIKFELKEIAFRNYAAGEEHASSSEWVTSAIGVGLAFLPDPNLPHSRKYILVHEASGLFINRNWGCERTEQMVALIEKIAPLLDWNKPMEKIFEGHDQQAIELELSKAYREVGGKDWDADEEERSPAQNIELAEAAMEKMREDSIEEWMQNNFGDEITHVIFAALSLYIDLQKSLQGA